MKVFKYLLCLIAGILLTLSFAPFYLSYLAPISLALALYTWQNTSQKAALWRGFLYGLGFFGSGIFWVAISIYRYGGADLFLAILITAGFIIVLACLPACQAVLYTLFYRRQPLFTWLFFPLSWVLLEWVRANAFTGFPWILLGVSQVPSPLAGFAALGSVYLASLMTALVASLIFSFFAYPKLATKITSGILLLMIYATGSLILHFEKDDRPLPPNFSVALIQGDVPQEIKWDPSASHWILQRYEMFSSPFIGKAKLIIWPEAALTSVWPWNHQELSPFFQTLQTQHTSLIFGSPAARQGNFYNALIAQDYHSTVYFKRHLVPLGEYIPFAKILIPIFQWFNFPISNFSQGQSDALLQVAGLKIAPFICYEIAYPSLMPKNIQAADLLLTISDDGWFGHSLAAWQHLESAQMAALTVHRPLLFVSNTGVTAVINAHGQILKRLPRDHAGVLYWQVQKPR